jgi:hypothetical protein
MAPGQVWRIPVYWPGGARHGGDASLICCFRVERGKAGPDSSAQHGWRKGVSPAAETVRDRVPVRDSPADRPVVVTKLCNEGGAKGPGHPWLCSFDQPGVALGGVAWTS